MGEKESKWAAVFGSEWEVVVRLGSAISDPVEKKQFWDRIKEAKTENPRFSIYDLYPGMRKASAKAMKECVDHVRSLRRAKKSEGETA